MANSAATAADQAAGGSGDSSPTAGHEIRDAIELLADLTEAYTAALFVREPHGQTLHPVAWHTLSRSFRADESIRLGEGLVGYVAKHQVPVDVDRYQQKSTATRLYAEDEGIKAFLAVPVGQTGVLVVDTKTRRVFGEREKKLVREFARFFLNLLSHQDTCSREAMYGRILDLLYEVENASLSFGDQREYYERVLDAGRLYTGLGMGLICLLHPGRRQFVVEAVAGPGLSTLRGRSFPVSQGLAGWVLREGRAMTHGRLRPLPGKSYIIAPEEQLRGYNTFIGVPLLAWRQLVGVWAYAGQTQRIVDEEEQRALQLAGHRVAATLNHYGLLR